MKTILAPIDFSKTCERVVDVAGSLASVLQGKVILLHVVQLPQPSPAFEVESDNFPGLSEALEQTADELLSVYQRRLQERSVPTDTLRLMDHPAQAIVEQARKVGAEYLVMGTHGHTAFYDRVLGCVAEEVVRHSPCPIIVVPPFNETLPTSSQSGALIASH